MYQNAHETYLEGRITSADPLELVRMLYHGASGAVRDARRYLADGDIQGRSRSITKACEILIELTVSLNHSAGGDISRRLEQLYDYMQRRLLEANFQQADAPLAEVLGLLVTLGEAWDQVGAKTTPPAAREDHGNVWGHTMVQESAMESSHAWSF
jgi:flagellar secretion chaperone FliS